MVVREISGDINLSTLGACVWLQPTQLHAKKQACTVASFAKQACMLASFAKQADISFAQQAYESIACKPLHHQQINICRYINMLEKNRFDLQNIF